MSFRNLRSRNDTGDRRRSKTDDRIIAGFLDGAAEAVGTLAGWARGVTGHRAWGFESPEDIVQATLLALVQNLRGGRFTGGDLRAYVRRIAKNLCITSYRRARSRGTEVALDDAEGPAAAGLAAAGLAAAGIDAERRALLNRILDGLDEACQRIIGLAYAQGLRRKEIAEHLGISEGAAKVRLFRCLEKARERLAIQGV